jgi:hypothetical protein
MFSRFFAIKKRKIKIQPESKKLKIAFFGCLTTAIKQLQTPHVNGLGFLGDVY